jgi:hypothetical protein
VILARGKGGGRKVQASKSRLLAKRVQQLMQGLIRLILGLATYLMPQNHPAKTLDQQFPTLEKHLAEEFSPSLQ